MLIANTNKRYVRGKIAMSVMYRFRRAIDKLMFYITQGIETSSSACLFGSAPRFEQVASLPADDNLLLPEDRVLCDELFYSPVVEHAHGRLPPDVTRKGLVFLPAVHPHDMVVGV